MLYELSHRCVARKSFGNLDGVCYDFAIVMYSCFLLVTLVLRHSRFLVHNRVLRTRNSQFGEYNVAENFNVAENSNVRVRVRVRVTVRVTLTIVIVMTTGTSAEQCLDLQIKYWQVNSE